MLRNNRSVNSVGMILIVCVALIAGCTGASFNLGSLGLGTSPSRTGTLLYADPGVTIMRDSQKQIRYDPGMEVLSGDSIETTNGQAVIDYADGSAVILNRDTRIQLGSITLFFGELFARVKKIAKQGGGQVVTNELSASVEGTEYGVRRNVQDEELALGNVQVYVRNGKVLCSPGAYAYWSPIMLNENQAFEATGNRRAPAAYSINARDMSRWADDAERRLRKKRPPEIQPSLIMPSILRRTRVPQDKRETSTESDESWYKRGD